MELIQLLTSRLSGGFQKVPMGIFSTAIVAVHMPGACIGCVGMLSDGFRPSNPGFPKVSARTSPLAIASAGTIMGQWGGMGLHQASLPRSHLRH